MFGWATIACSGDIMEFVVNEHQLFSTVVRGRVPPGSRPTAIAVSETFLAVAWARDDPVVLLWRVGEREPLELEAHASAVTAMAALDCAGGADGAARALLCSASREGVATWAL